MHLWPSESHRRCMNACVCERMPGCRGVRDEMLQHPATPYTALQRPATHCNALQHTATYCWEIRRCRSVPLGMSRQCVAVRCSALQRIAVRCSALQCGAVRCSAVQRVAACCSVLQCVQFVAVCCSTWHETVTCIWNMRTGVWKCQQSADRKQVRYARQKGETPYSHGLTLLIHTYVDAVSFIRD